MKVIMFGRVILVFWVLTFCYISQAAAEEEGSVDMTSFSFTFRTPWIEGILTPDQVSTVLRPDLNRVFKNCFVSTIQDNQKLPDNFILKFTIRRTGEVKWPRTDPPYKKEIRECMGTWLKSLVFPKKRERTNVFTTIRSEKIPSEYVPGPVFYQPDPVLEVESIEPVVENPPDPKVESVTTENLPDPVVETIKEEPIKKVEAINEEPKESIEGTEDKTTEAKFVFQDPEENLTEPVEPVEPEEIMNKPPIISENNPLIGEIKLIIPGEEQSLVHLTPGFKGGLREGMIGIIAQLGGTVVLKNCIDEFCEGIVEVNPELLRVHTKVIFLGDYHQ